MRELGRSKNLGTRAHEVLFDDDTIIYSNNADTLTRYLHRIQEIHLKYGLRLNET